MSNHQPASSHQNLQSSRMPSPRHQQVQPNQQQSTPRLSITRANFQSSCEIYQLSNGQILNAVNQDTIDLVLDYFHNQLILNCNEHCPNYVPGAISQQ